MKDYVPFDVRIINSHIVRLNKIIGKTVFRKDTVYISSNTLWEIMQPLGGRGKHNFHNLKPEDIYNALSSMKKSTKVEASYDGRYLIITTSVVENNIPLAIVVDPKADLNGKKGVNVTKIITIYPINKK